MEKHTYSRFDEELEQLRNILMEMARLCENQLHTINQYLRCESNLAALMTSEALDDQIDQHHIKINADCMRLIAKRAPVARDLRFISACDRMTTDFERIGDENCKIIRFLRREAVNVNTQVWKEIRPAARLAKNLLSSTINMLAHSDTQEAHRLIKDDEELDANYKSTTRIIISYMIENSSMISESIDVLMAAKALERIGDHCINIAEAVIFAQEGEDIRHRSQKNEAQNISKTE